MEEAVAASDAIREAVRSHIRDFWRGARIDERPWRGKPVGGTLATLDIALIASGGPNGTAVYVTNGISSFPRKGARCEMLIVAAEPDETHREHLAMMANFHTDLALAPIETGRLINIGRPWCAHSRCDFFMAAPPYLQGPDFEWCDVATTGERVRFLWLTPITSNEAAYARRFGQDSLEQLLESRGVVITEPLRESVVCDGEHSSDS